MEKGGTADAEKEKVEGLKKGAWTREEDEKLLDYILHFGHGSWRSLPAKAGLRRCGKSCRLRWTNYLRPDIKRGKFSFQEQQTIIQLHALLGNRWSTIATHLPRRTDNEIKNYWNTHLKKRLTKMGIDPMTHKPKSNGPHIANLSHMAQWESARLQAEARLGRDSSSKRTTPTNPRFQPHKPSICLDVFKACQGGANWLKPPIDPSPTSTLSFSENLLPLPSSLFGFGDVAAIHYNENLGAFEGETTRVKQVEWKCLKENGVEDGGKSMREGNMTTSSVVVDNNIESNNYRGTLDNVVGTGSLEAENKDYWNNILLYGLNTWASDSPVLF